MAGFCEMAASITPCSSSLRVTAVTSCPTNTTWLAPEFDQRLGNALLFRRRHYKDRQCQHDLLNSLAMRHLLGAFVLVPALKNRQHIEPRKFRRHHLIETEDAFGMVAQALRPATIATFPCRRTDQPTDQRAGRTARGDIVDADIVVAARGRHVRNQGDDLGAAIDEIIDRGADARMIQRDHRDAVEITDKGLQRGSQHDTGSNTSVTTVSTERRRAESQPDISPR